MAPLEVMSTTTPRMEQLEGGGAAGSPESPSDRVGSGSAPAAAHYSGVESLAWRDLSYFYRVKGGKGKAAAVSDTVQASKTALTIYGLQQTLRNARLVYSSATIATKYVCCCL